MKTKFYLLLSVLVFTACGDLGKKMELVQINQKYLAGKLEEAKSDVKDYLKTHEKNEYAWTVLGNIHNDMDEDSLATIAFNKALEINPDREEALTGMGINLRRQGKYKEAEKYYNKAIKVNPDYAEAYTSLVTIHLKQKEFKKAVEIGEKGYKLDNENPVMSSNLSIAYHYYGDTIKRNKYFEIAKKKGYPNIETLNKIFNGEIDIID